MQRQASPQLVHNFIIMKSVRHGFLTLPNKPRGNGLQNCSLGSHDATVMTEWKLD